MMTKRERLGKEQIIKKLGESGYPTYADLFSLFDLHLTKDPDVVGFMVPEKAEITINENLDIEQVSLVVRHEILHEFLDHKKRIEKIGGKMDQISNIAGDYEISNVGYTDADKSAARSIRIGDRVLQGLVTDYDHPDWVDKTYEEIYELLKKESPESLKQPQIGNRGNKNIQDAENAERRAQSIRDSASDAEQQAKKEAGDSGQGQSGNSEDSESGESKPGENSSQGAGDSGEQGSKDKSSESGGDGEDSDSDSGSSDGSSGSGKKRNKYDDEEYKNMSPEEKKKERARRRREAAKKLKEEADKLIDDIKDVLDEPSSNSGDNSGGGDSADEVFDTPEEQREKSERIKKIKEILSDLGKGEQILSESASAVQKDKAAKAAKDAQKYRSSPLTKFTESLNKFIRDAVARARNNSWAHINKKYVNSGLLRPGQSYSARGNVPLINVYFDRSGSWDKEKTLKGQEAIATLNRYVIRGEIKLNLYYFNTEVGSVDMGGSGGTRGEPILQHILQTKPNNVIVLTDDDISDCRSNVIVPGAVWFLWYGTDHNQIADYLSGKQLTKEFRIE